jgi:chromate transporter
VPAVAGDPRPHPGSRRIFLAFLLIGATSFGGGVVAHLRNSLVVKHRWVDDETFVELLVISQTLPGLKATNMAVLAGDRLRGTVGALAAIAGICLPGAAFMYAVGVVYRAERERPLVEAGLEGVAAAAVGLILATTLQLGRQSRFGFADLVFIVLTVVCVNRLNVPVPVVLVGVGLAAAVWHATTGGADQQSTR